MNYIGSKQTLLPFIEQVFRQVTNGSEKTFCDLFAGTGAVGRHFKRLGLRIIANDFQHYAFALNHAYLTINRPPRFANLQQQFNTDPVPARVSNVGQLERVLAFVNALPGITGFITQQYSPIGGRRYYTADNAQKADAIRQALNRWRQQQLINEAEFSYLRCSLLEAIDQVANTASVYGAFLKQFKASAQKPLTLRPLALSNHVMGCQVFQRDANELIREIECDVLYLDPPYNHRQYGANYHVLETIAAYDEPVLTGVTGLRPYPRSRYCQPKAAAAALEDLIRHARAKHILLSYNDEGLLSLDDVTRILSLRGKPRRFETEYNRFKADNGRAYKRTGTVEFVHYVRVTTPAAASG